MGMFCDQPTVHCLICWNYISQDALIFFNVSKLTGASIENEMNTNGPNYWVVLVLLALMLDLCASK